MSIGSEQCSGLDTGGIISVPAILKTVHRTVFRSTPCGAPLESFAALKAESGDQRLSLWTPAREDLPCAPFHGQLYTNTKVCFRSQK